MYNALKVRSKKSSIYLIHEQACLGLPVYSAYLGGPPELGPHQCCVRAS